jgi:hypothetical protein
MIVSESLGLASIVAKLRAVLAYPIRVGPLSTDHFKSFFNLSVMEPDLKVDKKP